MLRQGWCWWHENVSYSSCHTLIKFSYKGTHTQQINVSVWNYNYLLFIKWKWIITRSSFSSCWVGWEGVQFSQFGCSVMSDSLRPQGLQHTRLPWPSPTSGAYSNSCPLSWWCYPTISSSVIPFSSHLQSFPASGSFQMSQLFASSGENTGVSASTSVFPMNIQDWFPLGWTGWISLQSEGLSRVLQYHSSKTSILQCSAFFVVQLSHL